MPEGIGYTLKTSTPIWLHVPGEDEPVQVMANYEVFLEP